MRITLDNYKTGQKKQYNPNFKGPMDNFLTSTLAFLDTNEMANAAVLDVGAMVLPRTYVDTKKRNKYAGTETFLREISGTFINCFSAGVFGALIALIANKTINPKTVINPKSWFSDDSIKLLKYAWDNSGNKIETYITNIFDNMSGQDGVKRANFKNINWNNVEWFDSNRWKKLEWNNPAYRNIQNQFTTREGIIETFAKIIKDKNLTQKDKKQIFEILEARLTNAMKVNRTIDINAGNHKINSSLQNIIRDVYDMGHDILTKNGVNIENAVAKIQKVNKVKIFGALALSSAVGISIQKLNRKITEKRTGKKGFVGDADYMERTNKEIDKTKTKGLWFNKILASVGMLGMIIAVMKIKNPKDFIKKLQFTGPVSTGNAIKTVYASTIIGRFLAADNNQELRESVVRDYLGFLNWLVLGGFAAKGIANILDKDKSKLFNINRSGKGLKHWLNDVSLKTHAEIAAHGKEFAKKNLWKLNVAHLGGLAYSTIALGILLPLINIKMSQHKNKQSTKPKN